MFESEIIGAFEIPLSINEFRFTATADFRTTSNFVELLTLPGTRLEGLTLLVINGEQPNDSNDNIGQITWAVDLSDAVADEDGYVLVGNDALTTFNEGDVVVEGFDPNGNAQTILVVRDFLGAVGDDLDTNDDGQFDTTLFSEVVVGVALADEDRDPNFLYAEDIVQADPLDPGFISAGGARQPDGNGDFVTLPYDTPALDTPGFANVAEPEPDFAVQIGTAVRDLLVGLVEESNLLLGLQGDDSLNGGASADLIIDGEGNDRVNGKGGDDILVFQGGKDRATGGEGADIFKLTADFDDNGTRDKIDIHDFDVSEDALDLTGALVASFTTKDTGLIVRLVGEGDVIVLRNVTDFDEIIFTDADLPNTGVSLEEYAELDPGLFEPLYLSTLEDGPRLQGSIQADVIEFFGGETALARGNGGSDIFVVNEAVASNGVADVIKIRDIGLDDLVDLGGLEINRVKEDDNRVKVFIGPDNDRLEFNGVSSVDEIVFFTDLILG